jgi:alcohol dehydrogenase class IV
MPRHAGSAEAGARTIAVVYEPVLTLEPPALESAGMAMNALVHCAEALYTTDRTEEANAEALAGAPRSARAAGGDVVIRTGAR